MKKKIFYIKNIFSDNKIKNYLDEYEKIKNEFNLLNFYSEINFPKNLTLKKIKNKIKSNISKKNLRIWF